ncbi:MAG: hypothetical protein RLZZ568_1076 [Cyanobacteriota bacterium]|jgi:hypothetical protein
MNASDLTMKRLSGLLQFVIGFVLGVGLFVGGISLAGYFIFNRFAVNPDKPVFPEEQPQPVEPVAQETDPEEDASPSEANADATSPTAEATPTPQAELPPGAYNARVSWNGSLIVRSEPSKQSDTVTSIRYQDPVIVLKNEGEWSQIKVGDSDIGWVRSGNLEKLTNSESL